MSTKTPTLEQVQAAFDLASLGDPFKISGSKGGGKGDGQDFRSPIEHPNTLQATTTARLVELIGEGPIVGLVDGMKSVFYDGTPVENADGVRNFDGLTIRTRVGTPNQTPIAGHSDIERETVVALEVLKDTPVTVRITDEDIDDVRVQIRIPQLTFQDVITGDLKGTSVQIRIEVSQNEGPFETVLTDIINGKTVTPFPKAYRFPLPTHTGGAPWDIRLVRVTDDSEDVVLQNRTFFASYTEIINQRMIYPNSALIATEIDAKQFGTHIPSRAYEIYGREVLVPLNYDPVNATYATTGPGTTEGLWNGEFKTAWTDNPAWIYLDMLTHDRYGLGRTVPLSRAEKYALYVHSQYNDGLVPSGNPDVFIQNILSFSPGDPHAGVRTFGAHGLKPGDFII